MSGERPGRFTIWWVATWPAGLAWMASSHSGGSFLLCATGLVIAVASRSMVAAGVLGFLELTWLWHVDPRPNVALLVSVAAWVVAAGAVTAAVPVPATFRRWCATASTWRRRWLAGDLPAGVVPTRVGGVSPESPERPLPGRSLLVPALVWSGTFVMVNAFRVVSPPVDRSTGNGWFGTTTIRRWISSEFFDNWSQWDSGQYLAIAHHGYGYTRPGVYETIDGAQHPMAWFPGYGLVVRWVTLLRSPGALDGPDAAHQLAVSGVIVSAVSGLAVALLLWTWLTMRGMDGRRRLAVLLCVMWFPYSFFLYGAIYADGLFLALVLGAFVLVEADRPVAAGLVAAAAATVRVNGVALIAALVVLAVCHPAVVERYRRTSSVWSALRVRSRWIPTAALAASGLGGFIVWCGIRYGEPLMYWNAHRALFPAVNPLAVEQVLRVGFLPSLRDLVPDKPVQLVALLFEAGLTVFALASVPAVRRRFGPAYAAFVLVQVATIWFSSFDFSGAGRYLLCVFPVAALWGERLAARSVALRASSTAGVAAMLLLTYYFCHTIDLGW